MRTLLELTEYEKELLEIIIEDSIAKYHKRKDNSLFYQSRIRHLTNVYNKLKGE